MSDKRGSLFPRGSRPAWVRDAQCSDLKRRTVILTGSTENKLMMPGFVRMTHKGHGVNVPGYVGADWIHPDEHPENDYRFSANCEGKYAALLDPSGVNEVPCHCGRLAIELDGYCLSEDCHAGRLDTVARLRRELFGDHVEALPRV